MFSSKLVLLDHFYLYYFFCDGVVGKTRRGVGVGDQWVKAGDWNLEDHLTELFLIHIRMGEGLLKFAPSLQGMTSFTGCCSGG